MAWRCLIGLLLFGLLLLAPLDQAGAQEGDALRFFQQNPTRSLFRTAPGPRRPEPRSERRETRERPVQRRPAVETELTEKPAVPPTVFVHVLGDVLAEALAQGLKEHFADAKPDIGVARKTRPNSGLVRDDYFDWAKGLRDVTAGPDKIDMLVMMVGTNDRQALRDSTGSHEFGSDRWREIYRRRIDDLLAIAKDKNLPFLIVGLPIMQAQRASADMLVINELLKERAARAGATFIDIWEGFATEKGEYASSGPDVNGATVRLRTSDGVLFTRAGARKLGFFVGKEVIDRLGRERPPEIAALPSDLSEQIRRELPVIAPQSLIGGLTLPELPELPSIGQRPLAGPVLALTTPPLSADGTLLRGKFLMPPTEMGILVEQALGYGRPPPAKAGRADDFAWPHRRQQAAGRELPPAPGSAPVRPVSAAAGSRP